MAMALAACGVKVRPEELLPEILVVDPYADLRPPMIATALRRGLLAVRLAPRLEAVLAEIADGRPVVVRLGQDEPVGLIATYSVARGYDLDRDEIIVSSDRFKPEPMSLAVFERRWRFGEFWTLVVTPPDHLPRSATPEALTAAALALERFDQPAARTAFNAIAQRALAHRAWVDIANQALQEGDARKAASAYANATRLDSGGTDAWAGLAKALLQLGEPEQAAAAARRAVALGGAQRDDNAELLQRIEVQPQQDPNRK
jgi:tetratricopeptide (TPR) repeat protein